MLNIAAHKEQSTRLIIHQRWQSRLSPCNANGFGFQVAPLKISAHLNFVALFVEWGWIIRYFPCTGISLPTPTAERASPPLLCCGITHPVGDVSVFVPGFKCSVLAPPSWFTLLCRKPCYLVIQVLQCCSSLAGPLPRLLAFQNQSGSNCDILMSLDC